MYSDIDNCQPTPCLNNGVCVDGLNSYSCDCTHGFVGENCSTSKLIKNFHIVEFYPQLIKCWNVHILKISDVNDCEGNPCNNGGTCQDGISSYTCLCPTGFIGIDCETSMFFTTMIMNEIVNLVYSP